MVETAGRPTSENLQDFYAAGFTEAQVLAIVLAVSVKTISNWSNHLFGTPVDDMFAERAWQPPAYA
jgi:alkylhydroperoxidase family enzyme